MQKPRGHNPCIDTNLCKQHRRLNTMLQIWITTQPPLFCKLLGKEGKQPTSIHNIRIKKRESYGQIVSITYYSLGSHSYDE